MCPSVSDTRICSLLVVPHWYICELVELSKLINRNTDSF